MKRRYSSGARQLYKRRTKVRSWSGKLHRRSPGRATGKLRRRMRMRKYRRTSYGRRHHRKRPAAPKRAAAVVTCMNEQQTLPAVLRQLERLPLGEIIVVINGSQDRSLLSAVRSRKTTVVWMEEALGHDVGRAVGARITSADIILFLDGDVPVPAKQLRPFLNAVRRGADVALNDLRPYIGKFAEQDQVTWWKTFLNRVLGRPDLAMNSMTAVPHAVSRKFIRTVGLSALAVPPKALAKAIISGLKVTAPASVDVIRRNRVRPHNSGERNPMSELIAGDHLEAIHEVQDQLGIRAAFPDFKRNRDLARRVADAHEHYHSVV